MRTFIRHWHERSYWRWLWSQRLSDPARVSLILLAALALGAGGYAVAKRATQDAQASDQAALLPPTTAQVTTIRRTVQSGAPGKPAHVVVTTIVYRTLTGPANDHTQNLSHDVAVRLPGNVQPATETAGMPVAVPEPGSTRVVPQAETRAIPGTETIVRPVTTASPTQTITDVEPVPVTVPGATNTVTRP